MDEKKGLAPLFQFLVHQLLSIYAKDLESDGAQQHATITIARKKKTKTKKQVELFAGHTFLLFPIGNSISSCWNGRRDETYVGTRLRRCRGGHVTNSQRRRVRQRRCLLDRLPGRQERLKHLDSRKWFGWKSWPIRLSRLRRDRGDLEAAFAPGVHHDGRGSVDVVVVVIVEEGRR